MKHHDFTGPQAVHEFAFVQDTDPALDAENKVEAGKGWLHLTDRKLYVRNNANTAWHVIGIF